MNAGFITRKATPADAQTIADIQRKSVETYWRPLIQEDFDAFLRERFDLDTQTEKYKTRAHENDCILVVVEHSEQIIGFAGARPHKPDEQPQGAHYQGNAFYIDPEYVGTAASTALLERLMSELRDLKVRDICGWCIAGNRIARNFYEKRGAELIIDAKQPEEYGPTPHVAYRWRVE